MQYSRRIASRWRRFTTSIRSRHSRRQLPIQRSTWALARGAMSGVKITRAPADLRMLLALAENFLSRSWMTAFSLIPSSSSVPDQVAGLLGHPRIAWIGRASGQQNAPGGQVHIDKDVKTLEEDGVDAEEVGHHQGLGLSRQELLPAQLGSATGGWNASPRQHGPNR